MRSFAYTHHHRTIEMKNRPALWIMCGGPGPWALATHWGNTLHREVNGDGENQVQTFFFTFFSSLLPLPKNWLHFLSCSGPDYQGGFVFYLRTSPADAFVSRWPLLVWPFHSTPAREKKERHYAWLQPTWITSTVACTSRRLTWPWKGLSVQLAFLCLCCRVFFFFPT